MLSWRSQEEEGTDLSTENVDEFLMKNREKQERETSAKIVLTVALQKKMLSEEGVGGS